MTDESLTEQAARDQRLAAYRELAATAHEVMVAFLVAGFDQDDALDLTMQILDQGYSHAADRREM